MLLFENKNAFDIKTGNELKKKVIVLKSLDVFAKSVNNIQLIFITS